MTPEQFSIGIPEEDLPNVFERFHRCTNVDDRYFADMGLRLQICRGIVEEHGGRIRLEPKPHAFGRSTPTGERSGGTIFHVELPVLAKT